MPIAIPTTTFDNPVNDGSSISEVLDINRFVSMWSLDRSPIPINTLYPHSSDTVKLI